ncbi:sulfatase-like hydrolase/transferase [Micromonospora sp. NBC_01699]|uniref:sulfatase-like hydrolase/transferase n=1 Tax=Micromonospora sp. NBC_01699 TaxID=2975984 RepID=UPI002E3383B8|nr:sulfatase-like hydrolase/transferase [Micromonospora sp. NBC_01699]
MADSPAPPDVPPRGRLSRWWRAELAALLEIVALCGLVVTQPLLDVTGRSPDFFLFYGAGPVEVLLLVAAFTVPLPLLVWAVGAFTRPVGPAVRAAVHTVSVGLLLAALAIQVGKHLLPWRGPTLVLVSLLVGTVGAYAHRRWRAAGQLLRIASVGPLVFVLLFVFASPASAVVLPAGRGSGPGAANGAASHPPVVILVLDELPLVSLLGDDGRVDASRFPNFAALAGGSTWYRNATGVSGWTPYALPAMLTGRYPSSARAPHYSQYPDNLFTALGGTYDLRVQESISQLCPPSLCAERTAPASGGLPELLRESAGLLRQIALPVDVPDDPESSYREATRQEAQIEEQEEQPGPTDPRFGWGALDANQPARFTRFLADLRPADKPTLHFLHLLMPHTPWSYLPSGIRYDSPPGVPNDGDGWVELARERHLLQLGYTDRLIGETLRTLRETGLYDDALVVVTADHGLSFTPGVQGRGRAAIDRSPGEVAWVPLFVKEPGQRDGRVDDRNWEHVDLLPTIADRAGVEVPWPVEGLVAPGARRERSEKRFHDQPTFPLLLPGDTFADVISGAARPALRAPPSPELVGRRVAELSVSDDRTGVSVTDRAAFDDVDPAGGRLPALVCGTVPASVRTGARIAVAVNGRIGAVVPVVDPDKRGRRFGALLSDESLFVPGANRLELFLVSDGQTLHRLHL